MKNEGKFSITCFKRIFQSWTSAVKSAGYEPIGKLSGEMHPDWKPNTDTEYYGPNWREQRAKCLGRDMRECRVCGKTQEEIGKEPSVHHIKPRSEYKNENYEDMNRLENLICLCPTRYGKFEAKWMNSKPSDFCKKAKDYMK